jgi:hypothetical protein
MASLRLLRLLQIPLDNQGVEILWQLLGFHLLHMSWVVGIPSMTWPHLRGGERLQQKQQQQVVVVVAAPTSSSSNNKGLVPYHLVGRLMPQDHSGL